MQITLALDSDFVGATIELWAGEDRLPADSADGFEMMVRDGFRPEVHFKVEPSDMEPILELVRDSRLPSLAAIPESGVDGVTYTLTLSSFMSRSSFIWWCRAPKGWGALNRLANRIHHLARKKCPDGYLLG